MNRFNLKVERNPNEFENWVWTFRLDEYREAFVLTSFNLYRRETKRHKFKSAHAERWNSYDKRGSGMSREQVPFDQSVIDDAKREAEKKFSAIQIVKE